MRCFKLINSNKNKINNNNINNSSSSSNINKLYFYLKAINKFIYN